MPAPTRARRAPATPKLHCLRCERDGWRHARIIVDRGQTRRKRGAKRLTHVHVACSNGHEWWSRNRQALALATQADAEARG